MAWPRSPTFILRLLILILLAGLGAAILFHAARRGFDALDSVSAYYYTGIGPVFIGALVGMGVCMILIRARYGAENTALKLAGMLAAVVATVPTIRKEDIASAIRACAEGGGTMGEECVSEQVLRETGANAGTISILVLTALVVISRIAFAQRAWRGNKQALRSMNTVAFVYLVGVIVLLFKRDWFIHNAHFVAAVGLFVCVLVLAMARGLTDEERQSLGLFRKTAWLTLPRVLLNPEPLRYAWVAWVMLAGVAVMVPLWLFGIVTLFWLEIVIGALFVLFWLVQMTDRGDDSPRRAVPLAGVAEPASSS